MTLSSIDTSQELPGIHHPFQRLFSHVMFYFQQLDEPAVFQYEWTHWCFLQLRHCGGEGTNQIMRSIAVMIRTIHLERSIQVTAAERLQRNGELLPAGAQIVLHHLQEHRNRPSSSSSSSTSHVRVYSCVYLCSVNQLPLSTISLFKDLQERIRLSKRVLNRHQQKIKQVQSEVGVE